MLLSLLFTSSGLMIPNTRPGHLAKKKDMKNDTNEYLLHTRKVYISAPNNSLSHHRAASIDKNK